ncbi:hypothetical protein JCM33374_g5870 [Metschnikowia sp. JCM 33374]|nr:hypothetical protein JCM33374_g5870 [Metschnikowia sp. JCM 33374]
MGPFLHPSLCADGGANRLYEYFGTEAERGKYIPKFITGDLDSLRDSVKSYYAERGSIVIPQYCQYSSDFMKAIKVVVLSGSDPGREALKGEIEEVKGLNGLVQKYVVGSSHAGETLTLHVAGGIGGRFDQTIQSINQMYALSDEYPWMHLVFFTSSDVIFMARKGITHVTYSDRTVFNTKDKVPKCGLLPFGKKTLISSKGLLYDVDKWPSEIGGNVSSSNGVCGIDGFIVETTENIVVNVEVSREFLH